MAKANAATAARQRRRMMTLLWIAVVAALVTGLIYKEQIALLYILATVSVTVLLVVVAMADLGDARQAAQPAPFDDSAALADGTTAAATAARARRR
jgi:undecaprenyl pyrophosphate phosphatase UppP